MIFFLWCQPHRHWRHSNRIAHIAISRWSFGMWNEKGVGSSLDWDEHYLVACLRLRVAPISTWKGGEYLRLTLKMVSFRDPVFVQQWETWMHDWMTDILNNLSEYVGQLWVSIKGALSLGVSEIVGFLSKVPYMIWLLKLRRASMGLSNSRLLLPLLLGANAMCLSYNTAVNGFRFGGRRN